MSKFKKRISKSFSTQFNAVVFGKGFGYLEEILECFSSVFVLSENQPCKHKNLIFREIGSDLNSILDVSVIFIDRSKIDNIDYLLPVIKKHRPDIIIEGNDVIERDYSKSLYGSGYRAKDQQGLYHVWKKVV